MSTRVPHIRLHPSLWRALSMALALIAAEPAIAQKLSNERMTDLNDAVPFGESEVASLAATPQGELLVACGGKQAHLLTVHPTNGTVRILKSWKEARLAHSLIVRGDRFWFVVGGDPNMIVPDDVTAVNDQLVGGRFENGRVTLTDLGAPTSGMGIATIAADPEGKRLFLVTRLTPVLHAFDTETGEYQSLAEMGKRQSFEDAWIWKGVPERVAEVPQTLAARSANEVCGFFKGTFFRWTPPLPPAKGKKPATGLTTDRKLSVPAAIGRQGSEGSRAETLLVTRQGEVYGGSYDGYLFRLDVEGQRIVNLGKPFRQAGLRALVELPDGSLAGACGEPGYRNRLFTWSSQQGFREIAMKTGKMQLPYDTFSALALLPDGWLCLGVRGRMTALLCGQLTE